MKKYWPLTLACIILFAYHYQYALFLLHLPRGTIIFNDFALLTYQAEAARNFFLESRAFWGYDPHFMAGWPLTFIWNSNVALQAACVLFRKAAPQDIIRTFLFMSVMLFPLIHYWSMRNFGFTRAMSVAGAAVALLYFRLGLPMLFHITGMVTAGMMTYVSILLISLLYRYCNRPDAIGAVLLIVISALSLLIHKTVIVIVFVPAVIIYFSSIKRLGAKAAVPVAAAAAAVAANWFWIGPMLRFMKYKTFIPGAPFWLNTDVLRPLKDYFTMSVKMNTIEWHGWYGAAHTAALWVLLAGGIAGLLQWKKSRDNRFTLFAASAAFLFVFGYYGSFIRQFAELNPTRYIPIADLLLAMPATLALAAVYRRLGGGLKSAAPFIAAAVIGCVLSFNHIARFDKLVALRPGIKETQQITALTAAIKSLPLGGRVLLEDSGVMDRDKNGRQAPYAYSQYAALLPGITGKQFIGGPYPYVFEKYGKINFYDGRLLGRDIDDYTPDEMRRALDTYDIKWAVCWSRAAAFYFESYPDMFRPAGEAGQFRIFEVMRTPNPFMRGSGQIFSTYNRIELHNVRAERGEIIIKYHWIETLRTRPPRKLERVPIPGDPLGFIKIKNPPEELVVVN